MDWPTRRRPDSPAPAATRASAVAARAPAAANGAGPASGTAAPAVAEISRRTSNGLKELLTSLAGTERAEVLDLGPVSQATVDFLTSRGFRLHTQDLLRSWREFLTEELGQPVARSAASQPGAGDGQPASEADSEDPARRPARFFARQMWYEPRKFHGVLLWDTLDYLDAAACAALVARLGEILRPGGLALVHLHDKTPERFLRYRVLDAQTLECIPASAPVAFQRVFANREIMNLFHDFRTSKAFVGRDQIREMLFMR